MADGAAAEETVGDVRGVACVELAAGEGVAPLSCCEAVVLLEGCAGGAMVVVVVLVEAAAGEDDEVGGAGCAVLLVADELDGVDAASLPAGGAVLVAVGVGCAVRLAAFCWYCSPVRGGAGEEVPVDGLDFVASLCITPPSNPCG